MPTTRRRALSEIAVLLTGLAVAACHERQPVPAQGPEPGETVGEEPGPAPVGPLAGAAPSSRPTRAQPEGTGSFGTEVYRARRRRVLDAMKTGAGLVYGAATIDPDAGGRQDADFYYLTGIDDAGAALLLDTSAHLVQQQLYLRPRNPEDERWTGDRLPIGRELELRTGFTRVRRSDRLGAAVAAAAERTHDLVFLGPLVGPDQPIPPALETLQDAAARVPGTSVHDLGMLLADMREVKEPGELDLMRHAIDVTRGGVQAAIAAVRPGLREFELKDVIEEAFRHGGARRLAFPSIVGSGPDSTVLHYPEDDRVMSDGEVVVCDVGAEYQGYASDITRTLPVGGRYTADERAIYDIVLRAQDAAIAAVRPGAYVEDVDAAARKVIEDAGYYDYFPHSTSHFVGLEVHDAGDYGAPLPVGAVITVEPGIYLPARGFGVRIEDEVLVTAGGHELLSGDIPRTAEEIEAAIARARRGR